MLFIRDATLFQHLVYIEVFFTKDEKKVACPPFSFLLSRGTEEASRPRAKIIQQKVDLWKNNEGY